MCILQNICFFQIMLFVYNHVHVVGFAPQTDACVARISVLFLDLVQGMFSFIWFKGTTMGPFFAFSVDAKTTSSALKVLARSEIVIIFSEEKL